MTFKIGYGFGAWAAHPCSNQIWVTTSNMQTSKPLGHQLPQLYNSVTTELMEKEY